MPAYIQSKVFAYKSWQPPNFRVHVPPKVPKEKEKEPELELGEIREETVLEDNPTISQDVDQSMADADDATHPDEDSIQEHLLSSVSEPLEKTEAVVEGKINEVIREMTPGSKHTPRSDEEYRQNTECILEEMDERKPIVDNKDDTGGNIDEEKVNKSESADAAKEKPVKKKTKPRKKKVSPEDQTTQSLGDKVIPFIPELCNSY